MPQVVKVQALKPGLPAGGIKRRLPSLGHGLPFPGENSAINRRYLSFAEFLANCFQDFPQSR
jgi:hypothetical protein